MERGSALKYGHSQLVSIHLQVQTKQELGVGYTLFLYKVVRVSVQGH